MTDPTPLPLSPADRPQWKAEAELLEATCNTLPCFKDSHHLHRRILVLLAALQAQEPPRAAIEAVVGRMIELRGLTNQHLRCAFCDSLGTDLHLPGCAIYELQAWLENTEVRT